MECKSCGQYMDAVARGVFLCSCGYVMEVIGQNEWRTHDLIIRMDKNVPGLKEWFLLFFKRTSSPF